LRSSEFGSVREYDDGASEFVALEYRPFEHAANGEWLRLRELWLDLPPHPHVLDAIDRGDAGGLLLRYAAFEWHHPQIRLQ